MRLISKFIRKRRPRPPRLARLKPLAKSRLARVQRRTRRLRPRRPSRTYAPSSWRREHPAAKRPIVWRGEEPEPSPEPELDQLAVLRRHFSSRQQRARPSGRQRPGKPPTQRARPAVEQTSHGGEPSVADRSGGRRPVDRPESPPARRAQIEELPPRPATPQSEQSPADAEPVPSQEREVSEAEPLHDEGFHEAPTVVVRDEDQDGGRSHSREQAPVRQDKGSGDVGLEGAERPAQTAEAEAALRGDPAAQAPRAPRDRNDESAPEAEPRKRPLDEVIRRMSEEDRVDADEEVELQAPLNQPWRPQRGPEAPTVSRKPMERAEPPREASSRRPTPEPQDPGGAEPEAPVQRAAGRPDEQVEPTQSGRAQPGRRQKDEGEVSGDVTGDVTGMQDPGPAAEPAAPPASPPPWAQAETQLPQQGPAERPPLQEVVKAKQSDAPVPRQADPRPRPQAVEPVQRAVVPVDSDADSGPAEVEGERPAESREALDKTAQEVFRILRRRLRVEAERARGSLR